MESVRSQIKVRKLDASGRQATSVRLIKSTIEHEIGALFAQAGSVGQTGELPISGAPEIVACEDAEVNSDHVAYQMVQPPT